MHDVLGMTRILLLSAMLAAACGRTADRDTTPARTISPEAEARGMGGGGRTGSGTMDDTAPTGGTDPFGVGDEGTAPPPAPVPAPPPPPEPVPPPIDATDDDDAPGDPLR